MRAFFFAILLLAIVNESVTVGSSPSGTFATIIPMQKMRLSLAHNCKKCFTSFDVEDAPHVVEMKKLLFLKTVVYEYLQL